ncbi:T9SS type A sorting domain-containing protein [uncultured Olleya sp.]|uniref:T9SS type A sorting domain-containing protein n=1 Tax=uncultured Olleya sp. TaxID=757243 RepID=UPI0025934E3D|nr:T9SS type A sorting domain-containing protein [uncultured Olleya sp.]
MNKTIILFLILLCSSLQQTFSQIQITGSEEFGRIFDLTYDLNEPNKIYAKTLGNHIVVSEDNGDSWDVLYALDFLPGATIEQLKLSENGTVLTFTAFRGNSPDNAVLVLDIATLTIIKSFPLPNQADLAYVNSYDFYDLNMDVLIVDTKFPVGFNTEGKTYYTADGGLTWDMIYYTNNNDTVFLSNVAVSPNNPDKLFLVRGNGSTDIDGGLLVSEDAGQTFVEKLQGIVLSPIAFNPLDDQIIYLGTGISFGGTVENLYKSTDGGDTFSIVPITWTSGVLDNITVIKFNQSNPLQIIVLEENEMVISDDGGLTFQNMVYPNDNTDSYYYGLNASYNPQNFNQIAISSNYIPLLSYDGGMTVAPISNPYFVSTDKTFVFRDGIDSNLYYGVQNGHVHRDIDSALETPYNIVPLNYFSNNITPIFVDQIIPNRIFGLSSSFTGSNFYVSNDNGNNQHQLFNLYTNYFTALATYPNNTNIVLAAFGGYDPTETILKKIDFTDINNAQVVDLVLPFISYVNGILIDNTGKITVAIGNEVYYSLDDGVTWVNISNGLENLANTDLIYDLQQDPLNANRLAIATSAGIFMSDNAGVNWTQKTTTIVHNVAFSTVSQGALVASTYNSQASVFQIYYSIDNGTNWQLINNQQLLSVASTTSSYYFDQDMVTVFVGTSDLGLMEYNIDLSTLGVPEFTDVDQKITVYPNPASNLINISIKNGGVSQVVLYSVTGSKIKTFNDQSNLDISNLASGIYILQIQDLNKKMFFKRIIKK